MTNILSLPRSGNTTTFTIATNADWLDSITLAAGGPPPIPIDLTGIAFEANMRAEPGGNEVFLALSIVAGSMINGTSSGKLSFNVPAATLESLNAGNYVIDILAIADGHIVNLYQSGPATVVVDEGIT